MRRRKGTSMKMRKMDDALLFVMGDGYVSLAVG